MSIYSERAVLAALAHSEGQGWTHPDAIHVMTGLELPRIRADLRSLARQGRVAGNNNDEGDAVWRLLRRPGG